MKNKNLNLKLKPLLKCSYLDHTKILNFRPKILFFFTHISSTKNFAILKTDTWWTDKINIKKK